jgi:hypothetical protein
MRPYFLILFLLFKLTGNAQTWTTAMHTGGSSFIQNSREVAVDASGNRIIVGSYSGGSAIFGTYTLPWTYQVTNPILSTNNGFVLKISPSNTILWAARISSEFSSAPNAVTVDNSGNVYVAGGHSGTCAFYNGNNPTVSVASLSYPATSGRRGYIVKYNSSGILQWVRQGISGASGEICSDIAVNNAGTEIAVSGRLLSGIASLGLSAGSYVAKLNSLTNAVVWAYNNSNDADYISTSKYGITYDNVGNIIVGGRMNGTSLLVKGASTTSTTITSNASFCATYSKYSTSGSLVWSKALSGSIAATQTYLNSIVVDSDNNIYIGGCVDRKSSSYNLIFPASDTLSIPSTILNQAFIAKISGVNGNAFWAMSARGTSGEKECVALVRNACDVIYAAVRTGTSCTFTDAFSTSFTESISGSGCSIIKFNKSGAFLLSDSWVASPVSRVFHIAGNNTNVIGGAGTTSGTISFTTTGGPLTLTAPVNDVISTLITDASAIPAPSVSLSAPIAVCNGFNISLSAAATGTGPFSYTWSVFNLVTSSFVSILSTSVPSTNILPANYQPYVFNFGGINYVWVAVTVTNCSGVQTTQSIWVEVKDAIQFSQVLNKEVCYTSNLTAPNAIFSVNALYADTYEWFYSTDNGITWDSCVGVYPGASTSNLTVNNITSSNNGFLFRCVMQGLCNSAATSPALLSVVPCPFRLAADNTESQAASEPAKVFPNPANNQFTLQLYNTDLAENNALLQILDLSGRTILEQTITQTQTEISTAQLPAGTYLWRVHEYSGSVQQGKLIITH